MNLSTTAVWALGILTALPAVAAEVKDHPAVTPY